MVKTYRFTITPPIITLLLRSEVNLVLAADDLVIRNSDATEVKAKFNTNGAVILYHSADEKLEPVPLVLI